MQSRARSFLTIAAAILLLGPGARASFAQQPPAQPPVIGGVFPTQLVRGETNVLHVAIPRNNPVQSVEFAPAQGITVTKTASRDLNQGSAWWEFTIDVAKDAAPGPRMMTLVTQNGRSDAVSVNVPDHSPNISRLTVTAPAATQQTIDLQLAAADQGGTFGATPYVWFLLSCGAGQPLNGVVRGAFANGTIKASIPNPKMIKVRAGAPAAGNQCTLDVHATDSAGVDSNTTTAMFAFKQS
jgi:hypothetical protein